MAFKVEFQIPFILLVFFVIIGHCYRSNVYTWWGHSGLDSGIRGAIAGQSLLATACDPLLAIACWTAGERWRRFWIATNWIATN